MTKTKAKNIPAQLTTLHVNMPFESDEQKKQAQELYRDIGVSLRPACDDWGYTTRGTRARRDDKDRKFQSGDLVKIFKTVTRGDVLWQGTYKPAVKKTHMGYPYTGQKDMSYKDWATMFMRELPARFERDGEVLYGCVTHYSATGEGFHLVFQAYGKPGYAGLNFLKAGDKLTIYEKVYDGDVEWEGALDFDKVSPTKISQWGPKTVRMPKHMDAERWLQMNYDRRPILVTPKPE